MMLNSMEKGIIALIKSSLYGGEPSLPDSFSLEEAYKFCQLNQVLPLVYYGAINIPGFLDTMIGKKFTMSTMRLGMVSQTREGHLETISQIFDANEIEYMKLKGTVIKDYYSSSELRMMGDIDILIKPEQYSKIRELFLELGYYEGPESDHELMWFADEEKDYLIELHKRMIPSYNKDYYEYYGDGWKLARRVDGKTNEYRLSDEDFFIYIFTHFAKHYRDMGIGIRHFVDFEVFLKKHPCIDMEYIRKELEALQLLRFWDNVERLLKAWFEDGEWDDVLEHITRRIFSNGPYGNLDNFLMSDSLKKNNAGESNRKIRFKKTMHLIFPDFKVMKGLYPVLEKAPILLPIMWPWRWVSAVIFKPTAIKQQADKVKRVNNDNIDAFQKELNYVGLDFNFN
ncbi:MAG: nucleotidyltransferase family protein [Clostridia bacterium]|nr:nucleotidyltransferase family protein [Clostridia bacterium]